MSRLLVLYYGLARRLSSQSRRIRGVSPLLDAWNAYSQDQMGVLAAALAYYFLLALFPLLLLLIALASFFLNSDQALRQTTRFVDSYLPTLGPEFRNILREVISARGPAGALAVVGLAWSASGVFDLIQRGLDRAWRVPLSRPLWRQRLLSVAAVLAIGLLFGLSFVSSALGRAGFRLRVDVGSFSVEVVSLVLTVILSFVLFAFIYRYFPNLPLHWRDVLAGALFAALVWEAIKYAFVWYLLNFARLNMVYGSVGAVIALLIWGYVTASILLYGAELCAREARGAR